jgi:diaminopimelate decarboxylase
MDIKTRNGKSYLRDICLEDVAQQYGTPFYLYDLNTIYSKIQEIRDAFGDYIKLYYAIKANSNLELLKAMREKVDGLDISSYGEMEQSLLAGYDPKKLSFAGPGKTCEELEKATAEGIGIISVESQRELEDLSAILRRFGKRGDIALRINPMLLIKEFSIKMGGQPTQFGIDEERVDDAMAFLRENGSHLNVKGIHVYSGTQCQDENALVKNVENVLAIAKKLEESYDFECSWINLGGGFGVSHHDHQKLDIGKVAQGVREAIDKFRNVTRRDPCFVLELGRYLVADAGIYVAKVVSHKESRGKKYFILDGGMNHHLAASGNFGQILKKNYLVKNLSNPGGQTMNCNFVGPLCTTLDLMGKDISVETPRLGDCIAFLNSGSYGLTSSPLMFLGHETPIELLAIGTDIRVCRKTRRLTDFN